MSRYIDADKLNNYIDTRTSFEGDTGEIIEKIKLYTKAIIDNQPTADVRENIIAHKVIGGGEHDGATCWFECSRCGKTIDVNDKYCSECGARFEE